MDRLMLRRKIHDVNFVDVFTQIIQVPLVPRVTKSNAYEKIQILRMFSSGCWTFGTPNRENLFHFRKLPSIMLSNSLL